MVAHSLLSTTTLVLATAALLTLLVGWFGLAEIERRSRGEMKARLNAEVDTSALALKIWLDEQRNVAESWAGEAGVQTEITEFAASPFVLTWNRNRVLASDELKRLRTRLAPVCQIHDYLGFLVIDAEGRQIAALLDDAVGESLSAMPENTIRRVEQGESVVTPPFTASILLPDERGRPQPNQPTMLVAAPVKDHSGAVVAILAFRLRPERQFARAMESGRAGETGETYAFDKRGLLLSDSRFDDQLRQVGLISKEPTSRAVLALEVRDPGGNLLTGFRSPVPRESLALTRMAASAVDGNDGVDVAGYRDYRGVPVVGAWRWLPSYGLGVTHEIDLAQAYAPLYSVQRVFLGCLGLFAAALATSIVLQLRRQKTERLRAKAQEALTTLSNRFQAVLDSATQVSIIATDMAGYITVFNVGAERMLQYRAEEVIGRLTPAVIHLESEVREHGEQLSREFGRSIQGFDVFVESARRGKYEEREWTYIRKDGSHLTVNLVVTALRDSSGTMTGFLGIAKDVTQSKAIEDSLRSAKESAEAASRAKSEFLANMSHEIRTPMNAVIGMTELVLGTDLNPVQRDYLAVVLESGESLLAIINEILDFSKIEAGEMKLDLVDFAIRDVVGDSMKPLALRAQGKGLELAYHVAHEIPKMLVGDPVRLRQIIVNLVGNAIKFTQRGEILVDICCVEQNTSGVLLRFSVTDSGMGIPPDKQKLIFDAFTQADSSTTRRFGGTGLGLAISSRLVSLLGGELELQSELDKGSTFSFAVWLTRSKQPSDSSVDVRPDRLRGVDVLIVDDNATNRWIIEEMVRSLGMKPLVTSSAPEALQQLKVRAESGRSIPVLLTDVHMPDMDGLMLVEQIRSDPCFADLSVIVMTSGDQVAEADRWEKLKVAARLMKPVKQSELLAAIQDALSTGKRGSGRAAEKPTEDAPQIAPLRILLAEDGLTNQKLAVALLQKWGHEVTVANNGVEAVHAYANQHFDLVLMDVQMPEMDGLEATAGIRLLERKLARHTPIVAMTGRAMKGDYEKCLEAGMDGYVSKPFRQRDLYQVITSVFAHRSADAAPSLVADWSQALRAFENDHHALCELISIFRQEAPRLSAELENGVSAGDAGMVRRTAHTLQGTLRVFGVAPLISLAARIENMGEVGDLKNVAPALAELKTQLIEFCESLEKFQRTAEALSHAE